MRIGIMQPYFLPYIGYWQLIKTVDKYVIYDDVNFINKSWINRNNILLNGQKHQINILLSGASQNKLINQIEVQSNQSKLIKTIEIAYKKAPMFNKVFPLFLSIMDFPDKNLGKFLGNSICEIAKYLAIDTDIVYSSEIAKNNTLKSEEKILHICEILNADTYINAIGGKELYDKNKFQEHNIELLFLETQMESYKQFKNEFIPYLSILDLLMFLDQNDLRDNLVKFNLL